MELHCQNWDFRLKRVFLFDDLPNSTSEFVAIQDDQLDPVVTQYLLEFLAGPDPITVCRMPAVTQGGVDQLNVVLIVRQDGD